MPRSPGPFPRAVLPAPRRPCSWPQRSARGWWPSVPSLHGGRRPGPELHSSERRRRPRQLVGGRRRCCSGPRDAPRAMRRGPRGPSSARWPAACPSAPRGRPVWKSTSASGAPDNSSPSHFAAMTRPCRLRRAVANRHRHAIEQASRRWRGGRREDSARTRRKNFDFHTGPDPTRHLGLLVPRAITDSTSTTDHLVLKLRPSPSPVPHPPALPPLVCR